MLLLFRIILGYVVKGKDMTEEEINPGRRRLLVGGAALSLSGAACSLLRSQPAVANGHSGTNIYPSNRIGNIKDLKVDAPIAITYPDTASPGILLKLGHPVEEGVGPDQDIVAFSTLCPHKGVLLKYVAADKSLNCEAHQSRFDCEKGGQEIWGHATQNLPQFTLRVNNHGDIFAEGVDELIYGRLSNVLMSLGDESHDL
jgi:arsenite oxidase small subunit